MESNTSMVVVELIHDPLALPYYHSQSKQGCSGAKDEEDEEEDGEEKEEEEEEEEDDDDDDDGIEREEEEEEEKEGEEGQEDDIEGEDRGQNGEPDLVHALQMSPQKWVSLIEACRCGAPRQILRLKVSMPRDPLQRSSTYFSALLSGDFRESSQDFVSVNWNLDISLSLLCYLCSGHLNIHPFNAVELLEGAMFFGVNSVIHACLEWISSRLPLTRATLDEKIVNFIPKIWTTAVKMGLEDLADACVKTLAINFVDAMKAAGFDGIPLLLLNACIDHKEFTVHSEKQLCKALLHWLVANTNNAKAIKSGLFYQNGKKMQGIKIPEDLRETFCDNDTALSILRKVRICLLPVKFVCGRLCAHVPASLFMVRGAKISSYDQLFSLIQQIGITNTIDTSLLENEYRTLRLTRHSTVLDLHGCEQVNCDVLFTSALHAVRGSELEPTHITATTLGAEDGLPNESSVESNAGKARMWLETSLFNMPLFENLSEINLDQCWRINQTSLATWLGTECTNLKVLKASHCPELEINFLTQLSTRCTSLEVLDLSMDMDPILGQNFSIVEKIDEHPYWKSRISSYCYSQGSYVQLTHLTMLSFQGRTSLTDQDLKLVASYCPNISSVNIGGCSALTDKGIGDFLCSSPMLKSLEAPCTAVGLFSLNSLLSCSMKVQNGSTCLASCESLGRQECLLTTLDLGSCTGLATLSLGKFLSVAFHLKTLCLGNTCLCDAALNSFVGTSLEQLDLQCTKVSGDVLAKTIMRNPKLKLLNVRGCVKIVTKDYSDAASSGQGCTVDALMFFKELGKQRYALETLAVGWGFSDYAFNYIKPSLQGLKTLSVGVGGSISENFLSKLAEACHELKHLSLCFQVVSDEGLIDVLKASRKLQKLELQNCLGQLSSKFIDFLSLGCGFKLRALNLERVVSWMEDNHLAVVTRSCPNLTCLRLVGCRCLTSESLPYITESCPRLIDLQLEECGKILSKQASSIFNCKALQKLVLRHNGRSLNRDFAKEAVSNLMLLRSLSLDLCDSIDKGFDTPQVCALNALTTLRLARCYVPKDVIGFKASKLSEKEDMQTCHKNTIVVVWNGSTQKTTIISERL